MAKFKTKFDSARQNWETPDSIFKPLDDEFHFTLDVCATKQNRKCKKYFSEEDNGLAQDWNGEVCWMNPPFGKQAQWVEKAWREYHYNKVTTVCLLPARTNTNWFHELCLEHAQEIRIIRGRPKFKGAKYGLPLMVVIFSDEIWQGVDGCPVISMELE